MERLIKEHGVSVEWRAFELRPMGTPHTPKPEAYMQRAWENIKRLNREFGMPEMRRNSHQGMHSRFALEGQKYAIAQGRGDEYTRAVFGAMFYDDRDISDLDILTELAEQAGLDPAAFRAAVEQRLYSDAVAADVEQAARWGITGIPCFVSNNRGATGVQSYEDLVRLISGEDLL